MKVFTYYVPVNGMSDAQALLALWKRSWERRGWQAEILGEEQASAHPKFATYRALVESFPSINNRTYELACWMRWLAFATVGGGLTTDFDVMNRSLAPDQLMPGEPMVMNHGRVPCCVCADMLGAEKIIEGILESARAQGRHYSDMYWFRDRSGFAITERENTLNCVEVGDWGWTKAAMVHFSHGATDAWNKSHNTHLSQLALASQILG